MQSLAETQKKSSYLTTTKKNMRQQEDEEMENAEVDQDIYEMNGADMNNAFKNDYTESLHYKINQSLKNNGNIKRSRWARQGTMLNTTHAIKFG